MALAQVNPVQGIVLATAVIMLVVFLVILLIFVRYFRWWLRGTLAGAPIPLIQLLGMTFRKTDPGKILDNLILARQSGVMITASDLERAYLRGVDIDKVTLAAIESQRRKLELSFEQLVDAELEGRLADKLGVSRLH
jgi:uncharacterized protein YqfA (UPF0365 family)